MVRLLYKNGIHAVEEKRSVGNRDVVDNTAPSLITTLHRIRPLAQQAICGQSFRSPRLRLAVVLQNQFSPPCYTEANRVPIAN